MKSFALFFLVTLSSISYSQSKYINIQAGYGLGTPGFSTTVSNPNMFGEVISVKSVQLAGGLNAGVGFGLINKKNWGVDFNFAYQNQLGQEFVTKLAANNSRLAQTITETFYSTSFRFSPALRIQVEKSNFTPFLSIGPSILYSSFLVETEFENSFAISLIEEEFTNGFSFGAVACIGIEKQIRQKVFIYAAVQYAAAYISPTRSDIVKFEVDNVSRLDDLTYSEKETIYEKSYSVRNEQSSQNPLASTVRARQTFSYSAVNVVFGIRRIF